MRDDPFTQRPGGSPPDRADDARSGRGEYDRDGLRIVWLIFAVLAVLALLGALGPLWGILLRILIFAAAIFPPLLAVPTIALYAAGVGVLAVVLRLCRLPWRLAVGGGLFVVIAFGLGFPLWAEHRSRLEAARLTATDFSTPNAPWPDSIAILQPAPARWGRNPPMLCETLCQTLLLGGDVAWVRIQADGLTFHVEQRESCPTIYPQAEDALPPTRQAMAQGICIVPWPEGAALTPAARITVDATPPSRGAVPSDPPSSVQWRRRTEIALREGEAWTPIARRTELLLTPPRAPLFLVPRGDMSTVHLAIARRDVPSQQADPAAMLRTTFGFRLALPTQAGDEGAAATRALLARDDTAPFDAQMNRLVFETMAVLGRRPSLTAEDAALVRAVVADARLTDASAAEVLRRHAQLAAALAPVILARVEVPGDDAARRSYAHLLATLPRATWQGDTARIIRLLSNGDDRAIRGLRGIAGQLGVDPTPWMVDWLRVDPVRRVPDPAATRGACRSDPQWWASLAPLLEAAIRSAHGLDPRRLDNEQAGAFVALHRIGAPGQARALFDELYGAHGRFVQQQVERIFGTEVPGGWTRRPLSVCGGMS